MSQRSFLQFWSSQPRQTQRYFHSEFCRRSNLNAAHIGQWAPKERLMIDTEIEFLVARFVGHWRVDWCLFDIRLWSAAGIRPSQLRFAIGRTSRKDEKTTQAVGNGTPSSSRCHGSRRSSRRSQLFRYGKSRISRLFRFLEKNWRVSLDARQLRVKSFNNGSLQVAGSISLLKALYTIYGDGF